MSKIRRMQSIYGLSVDTQISVALATLSRCVWSLETRLVETWIVYVELILSAIVSVFLCQQLFQYRTTASKQASWPFRCVVTLPASFLLAMFFHPGGGWFTMQTLVSFTIYAEAIALLPQLQIMRNVVEIEPLTQHYVLALVLAHVVRLGFWLSLFMQGERFLGLFFADILHTMLSGDYLVLWMRKLRKPNLLVFFEPNKRTHTL